ncbi:MAG: serine/threonine protein kinase [Gemmataceae bacterium]|nr:serine/threonine protein kinase [Gemmataceae bacterium]
MAFQSGKLTWMDLESVGEHLSVCGHCVSNLEVLERESADPLIEKVRDCLADTSYDEKRQDPLPSLGELRWLEGSDITVASTVEAKPRTSTSSGPLPIAIGHYEILARLGHGGMGVVYRARHTALRRDVALKVIASNLADDANALSRFRTEGAAIARLVHPSVVRIFDFDEDQGSPYFAMELIEGENLAQRLKKTPLAFREAAELVHQIAEGVAFAHAAQVLHRDLKPANVLITAEGEAKLADFGLAKLLDDESGHTVSEMILGTPSYMAPEQAAGRTKDISAATDIWAVGIILYECIAGRPPFKGPDRASTLEMVCKAEPPPLSEARPGTPRDLEAISLKCLEKRRERRYASAQQLADDLGRWLRNEPTVARPASRLAKVWKASRTYVACAALAVGLAFAVPALTPADPQKALQEVEEKLAKDKRVTLIGEKGGPAWSRIDCGIGKTQTAFSADGSFNVLAWESSMIALLPKVPFEEYRITADVRHEKGSAGSRVGIYFADTPYEGNGVEARACLALWFNDQQAVADLVPMEPVQIDGKKYFKVNPNRDKNCPYAEVRFVSKNPTSNKLVIEHSGELGHGSFYRPHGAMMLREPPPWRRIEISVGKTEVAFQWEGETIARKPLNYVDDKATAAFRRWTAKEPNQANVGKTPEKAKSNGGIGLILQDAEASFRKILIESN